MFRKGVNLLVTPELGITAYTCADLFRERLLLECAEKACEEVARSTQGTGVTVAFGAPLRCAGKLFNCAVVASGGEIRGVVPKTHLPSYNEFYERRWFAAATDIPASLPFDNYLRQRIPVRHRPLVLGRRSRRERGDMRRPVGTRVSGMPRRQVRGTRYAQSLGKP